MLVLTCCLFGSQAQYLINQTRYTPLDVRQQPYNTTFSNGDRFEGRATYQNGSFLRADGTYFFADGTTVFGISLDKNMRICYNCYGSGRCTSCHGKGWHPM